MSSAFVAGTNLRTSLVKSSVWGGFFFLGGNIYFVCVCVNTCVKKCLIELGQW